MRRSRKLCQRGSNFDNVFFDEGMEDQNTTIRGPSYHYKQAIIGPPVKRHLNGISLAG